MDNKPEQPHVNDNYSTIFVMIIIFVITCVVYILYQRKKSSRRGVLLAGLCDGGKTVLFSHLVHGKFVNTHTSMQENIGDFVTKNGVLQVVDIPGSERLRGKFLDQYKSSARGLMYVVDSITIQRDIRDVAEYLYELLLDPVIAKVSALIVVCNKQDLPLAKSTTVIRSMLEKELNALRVTKSSQLDSVDQKKSRTNFLGSEGKDFTFSCLPIKVKFVEASTLGDPPKTDDLKNWLQTLY